MEALGLCVIRANDCHVTDFQEFHKNRWAPLRAGKADKKRVSAGFPVAYDAAIRAFPLHGFTGIGGLFLARVAAFK